MVWTPDAPHGPDAVAVNWRTGGYTTTWQPYWHEFDYLPGDYVIVNAKAIKRQGRQPGWVSAWLFDRKGNKLDSCGPTDAANGCTVTATVPPE